MTYDVLIVGAGISGLKAAADLQERGASVLVLEKSRGAGGRAATRRWDDFPVDHGAQFFTVRTPEFSQQVESWLVDGVCHEWARGFHQYQNGGIINPPAMSHPRYACRDGMSSLGRSLASRHGAMVERQVKVMSAQLKGNDWNVVAEDGRVWKARALLVTAPPAQSAALLENSLDDQVQTILRQKTLPCLAVAVRLPRQDLAWCGIQCEDSTIAWIGNDTSKRPELHHHATIVVVHANADFSTVHYDDSVDLVVPKILRVASQIAGSDLSTGDYFFHRWRYALPGNESCIDGPLRWDLPAPLVLAGDTWQGGKIEGAWLSGRKAAEILTNM